MSLDNLDAPLRMTWDLCPEGQAQLTDDELLLIADRLVDAGIFSLLLDERPLLHPGLPPVLERLSNSGCQIALVLGNSQPEWNRLDRIAGQISLFVDASPWLAQPDGLQGLEKAFVHLENRRKQVSMFWVPGNGQLRYLPLLLELCARLRVPRFKLPNRKIGANPEPVGPAGLLQPDDLDELKLLLGKQPINTENVNLEVHDLFLWELLFPQGGGQRSEYGGCQAGNSLGHIAVNGDVWPCSSWRDSLGNLLQQDLATLWDSPQRYRVRAEIAVEPDDCAGCHDYPICFGGCRGLSRSFRSDSARRDLLCDGPRKK